MSAPTLPAVGDNPSVLGPIPARPTRVQRVEALARRAEDLVIGVSQHPDPATVESARLLAEMGRELFRMAHALDGVV